MRKKDKSKPPPPEPTAWEKLKEHVTGEGYDRYLKFLNSKQETNK